MARFVPKPLVLEATTLPNEPQPLPQTFDFGYLNEKKSVQPIPRLSVPSCHLQGKINAILSSRWQDGAERPQAVYCVTII